MSTPPSGRPPALARFIARHRRGFVPRKLAGLARRYLDWHRNVNYDIETNGEVFVLETLQAFRPRVLFDAGANMGDWTRAACSRHPEAQVHAFEISPPTFQALVANVGSNPRVHCNNVGLSDKDGPITIRHYDGLSALTTATAYPHPFRYSEIAARTVRGDEHAARNGIAHIDLLKIDVEGMEEAVLRGFDALFARQAIDLVQFEYGRVAILNHFLLADFHAFFRERGYVLGKVYPGYVDFRDYDHGDEDFLGPNFLACRKDLSDYLRAFSAGAAR
ncbi:MAG TPA: FkbM family methyltransferase [Usitatibacter sp.]|nr:FkbM family methyltransferase [Usitatibacter sp.]